MRVVIFGASHGVGRETAIAALGAGHRVRAFARRPERIGIEHERLEKFPGDVTDLATVKRATKDQDVAVVTLGLPTLQAMGKGKSRVLSLGTQNVVAGMKPQRGKVIVLTAIGTRESQRRIGWLYRFALRGILRWIFKEKDLQEIAVASSGLPYVIVRPTTLTNAARRGGAKLDPERKYRMFTQVSRPEVADFIVAQFGATPNHGKAVIVSEPHRRGETLDWLKNYF